MFCVNMSIEENYDWFLTLTVPRATLVVRICQILTTTVGPGTVRVKIFMVSKVFINFFSALRVRFCVADLPAKREIGMRFKTRHACPKEEIQEKHGFQYTC